MYWIGLVAGAYLGSRLGLGPLGSLVCSVLGGYVEHRVRARRPASAWRRSAGSAADSPRTDPVREACRTLGVSPSASDEELRRAYRARAKECHPDLLRARGATEAELARATERMAEVNAAWATVQKARGL